MPGKIHPKGSMFLRMYVGEADAQDGSGYEMSHSTPNEQPMIRSKATGKTYSLSWQEIIELAIEAGIDDAD